ncbi:MAG: hypothetical protein LC791_10680 [Acidobacteria bacterium]|nr:hypothetical protein [Acidobacteriota bacterium]
MCRALSLPHQADDAAAAPFAIPHSIKQLRVSTARARPHITQRISAVEGDHRQRHIRILVSTRTTGDRLLATIAHELQHALEIVREADVIDGVRALALYRRIATGDCGEGLSEACETDAALAVEAKVLEELHRASQNEDG